PKKGKKSRRIPRACDLCSQRKVKCEGGDPPCQPCRDLNVLCTFYRVKRRRGPPNKAAEAARENEKRRRLGTEGSSEAIPPLQSAAQTLVSLATPDGQVVMDAEMCIAPLGVLQLLVDDFFTYIHPLTPFPHEPTFREAFKNREDRTNPEFLSLLASMIGGLVASFPRSARLHLKASHSYDQFPRAIMLVDRCMKVALAMRPTDYMLKDTITVNDAAISYFLCLGAAYTMRPNQCRRFLGESLLFLREMGFHKMRPPPTSLSFDPSRPDDQPTDFISDEIGKRIYWCIFLGVRSMSQLGASSRDLIIPPANPNTSYPEFPREVDDAYILADRILPQPEGTVSTITGFVKCAQIYRTMDDLVRIELSHGMAAYAWDQQKQYLHSALASMTDVAESLPPELKKGSKGISSCDYQYVPAAYPDHQPTNDVRHLFARDQSKKRKVQYEIQKANIYASLLATRSHYVERYLTLRDVHLYKSRMKMQADASGSIVYRTAADYSASSLAAAAVQAAAERATDSIDRLFLNAREEVVEDLFNVLISIDQRHMEPNGGSLISKIRQVACTLLSDRSERKGQHELHNEEYLRAFLDILTKLEKTGTGTAATLSPLNQDRAAYKDPGSTMTAQDEEQELRNWADLQEQQQKLAQSDYLG
ncbi:hypothetical protein M406DRAFT_261603, partial [Cryphonectria parasitica EP155]